MLTVLLMPLLVLGWIFARREWSSGMKAFLVGEGGFWWVQDERRGEGRADKREIDRNRVHTLFLVTQKVYVSCLSSCCRPRQRLTTAARVQLSTSSS